MENGYNVATIRRPKIKTDKVSYLILNISVLKVHDILGNSF